MILLYAGVLLFIAGWLLTAKAPHGSDFQMFGVSFIIAGVMLVIFGITGSTIQCFGGP